MTDIQEDAVAPAPVLEAALRQLVTAIAGEIDGRSLIAAAVLACTEAEKLKAKATKAPRLNLTVNQMLQAIEFATGGFLPDTEEELETSMTFSIGPLKDDDGKVVADGMHCWLTDLAGEGAIPLDEYPTEQDLANAKAVAASASAAEPQAQEAAITWPKARDVGRIGDMSAAAHIRVGLDSDNDVYVSVWDENGGGSIEFCNPGGGGGGQSSRTRVALIALMAAMEADNAEKPSRDWWAQRAAQAAAQGGA